MWCIKINKHLTVHTHTDTNISQSVNSPTLLHLDLKIPALELEWPLCCLQGLFPEITATCVCSEQVMIGKGYFLKLYYNTVFSI